MLDPQANPGGIDLTSLHSEPKSVAIVGLSFSAETFIREAMTSPRMNTPYDEVWTINRGIRAIPHDKLFCMDDLRWLAWRDRKGSGGNGYERYLQEETCPIVTSTPYPEFPKSVPYPYNEVLETIQDDVFNVNTISYMVAYAIHIGVRHLYLYGCDFVHPNGNHAEHGGQAVTFLLALGKAKFGMEFYIPNNSTLLYANRIKQVRPGVQLRQPYGYHRRNDLPEELRGVDLGQAPASKGGIDLAAENLRHGAAANIKGSMPAPERREAAQFLVSGLQGALVPAEYPLDEPAEEVLL